MPWFLCIFYFFFLKQFLNNDFDIVLITIDTLRVDHLSCYGYKRKTSPNIDKIANEGIRFTRTTATAPWTPPSMASIMTSLYPMSHGVNNGVFRDGEAYNQEYLSDTFTTLAEVLKENGYTTFGAAANAHMSEDLGFAQGFDYYYCKWFDNASELNKVVFSWKNKMQNSEKVFLWLHYIDPHDPYSAKLPWIDYYSSKPWRGKQNLSETLIEELKGLIPLFKKRSKARRYLKALYDSEVSFVDYHMGLLLDNLGLKNDPLIIITSDHGEEFLEHGSLGHAHTLYQELVHVPFIIKLPDPYNEYAGKTINMPTSILDIMPTILGFLKIPLPDGLMGKSLFDKYRQISIPERKYLFSERVVSKTILKKDWKYIYHYCTKEEQLYNIKKDRRETQNLIRNETLIAKELNKELLSWVSAVQKAPSSQKNVYLSREREKQLMAMGYIQNTGEEYKRKYSCTVEVCH